MKISEYLGCEVKVVCKNGGEIQGTIIGYEEPNMFNNHREIIKFIDQNDIYVDDIYEINLIKADEDTLRIYTIKQIAKILEISINQISEKLELIKRICYIDLNGIRYYDSYTVERLSNLLNKYNIYFEKEIEQLRREAK